ncbi:helix-turn-helix domain-containing protein [Microbacterium sp. VKM Ac-2923]|uniref:helix-turn-helix domain-containing protein n=1 Tax=Microbacterium sp. VKM Ac-2923 TaxID=2929476 RepID=UPI001FB2D04A|nr:helix-turn-helix domain-containing protein [Microbacterium sp. VKM Ac-2923]MCJ1709291.1 hypothetical protein [Microbacterium sp. VKM Ac-2923]
MAPQHDRERRVGKAIDKADRTQRWVSRKTGIALSTLNRKVNGHVDWELNELASVAFALGLHPASLLPDEFREGAAPSERRILSGIAA